MTSLSENPKPDHYGLGFLWHTRSMHRLTLGDFELSVFSDGTYPLDGGAFFGVDSQSDVVAQSSRPTRRTTSPPD